MHRLVTALAEHGALRLAQAVANATFCDRQHERSDRNVVELAKNRVGAGADLLGRLRVADVVHERGKELCESPLAAAAAGADLVRALDQNAHAAFDVVADLPHLLERLTGGVIDIPVFDPSYAGVALRSSSATSCSTRWLSRLRSEFPAPWGAQIRR